MKRTQIYLDEEDHRRLLRLSRSRRQSMADLVRGAVHRFLESETDSGREGILAQTAGAWRGRREETDQMVRRQRQEWERRGGPAD